MVSGGTSIYNTYTPSNLWLLFGNRRKPMLKTSGLISIILKKITALIEILCKENNIELIKCTTLSLINLCFDIPQK